MNKQVNMSEMVSLFEDIRRQCPHLEMVLERTHENVDLNMDIRRQPGLAFDVNLNLQGNELHLSAGTFWLEWFPCHRPDIVAAYRKAVLGLLSGAYRIVEHYRGRRAVKAELQEPVGDGWRTIGTNAHLPWLGRKTTRVLQNVREPHAG